VYEVVVFVVLVWCGVFVTRYMRGMRIMRSVSIGC